MIGKLLTVMFLTLSLILASCASHTAVYPDPVNIQSVIQPGDTVKIVTKDNQETEFVVTEVTDEYIIGENIKVSLKDITEIEEETVSAGINVLRITILTLGIGAAAILSEPMSFSSGISPESEAIADIVGEAAESMMVSGSYSIYHPGDWYAFEHDRIDEKLCVDECNEKVNCRYESNIEHSMQPYIRGINSCSA